MFRFGLFRRQFSSCCLFSFTGENTSYFGSTFTEVNSFIRIFIIINMFSSIILILWLGFKETSNQVNIVIIDIIIIIIDIIIILILIIVVIVLIIINIIWNMIMIVRNIKYQSISVIIIVIIVFTAFFVVIIRFFVLSFYYYY